ncbi:MAG: hypothetical protein QW514_04110 [Thermoprotei archaeon]
MRRSGAHHKLKLVVVLVLIVAFSAALAVYKMVSSNGTPLFTFAVQDQRGEPLANVSIQGFLLSPNAQAGFLPVFAGSTNTMGVAQFSGGSLTNLTALTSEWLETRGPSNLSASSPTILVFITYIDGEGIYFEQTSIPFTVPQLLQNPTYTQTITMNLSRPPQVGAIAGGIKSTPENITPASQTTLPNPSIPCGIGYSCWQPVGNPNLWPSSGTGNVPIAWIDNLGGGAYGEVSVALGIANNIEWDVGLGIGSGESIPTPEFEAGGEAWTTTTSTVFGQTVNQFSPAASYIYIVGQVVGELFQLYKCNLYNTHLGYCTGGYSPTNTYQYDTGIVNVATSNGYIEGGFGSGFPFYYNELSNNYVINEYENVNGTGSSTPYYKVYSNQFVTAWAQSDYGWISVGIPLGAVLALTGEDIPIATATLLNVVGTVTAGSVSFSLAWVQFDCPSGSTVYLYDDVGTASYYLTNGNTGFVPLMGVYIDT